MTILILERPVRYKEAYHYVQTLVGFGASNGYARSLVGMFAELTQGITRAEPRTAESTTPTTLAAWTESELFPLIESFRSKTEAAPVSLCNSGQ